MKSQVEKEVKEINQRVENLEVKNEEEGSEEEFEEKYYFSEGADISGLRQK